ncbi:MAG: hypothetical protein R3291_05475, partial [Thermoplasmata archaeon]|nr:hypothetical protein [Thermoplasmata archaeon]
MPPRGSLVVYQWIVFTHVGAALLFMLSHGASAAVAFRLRTERDAHRLRALLDISAASYWGMSLSWIAILGSGLALGFLGGWWQLGWFWTSLVLFFVITFVMTPMLATPYNRLRVALGVDLPMGRKWKGPDEERPGPEEVDTILESVRPVVAAWIGIVGILIV